jgi:hypothetical protein
MPTSGLSAVLGVCQMNGGSDLVHGLVHPAGWIRPSKVMANALSAGFVRREALLFEWR